MSAFAFICGRLHGEPVTRPTRTGGDVTFFKLRVATCGRRKLSPVENDTPVVRICLANDDETGASYHPKRVVARVKSAAAAPNELEAVGAGQ